MSQNKIGEVLVAQGNSTAALTAYRTALAIREALVARDPTNSQWAGDVAVSCGTLGTLNGEHDIDTRRAYLTRGREILSRLRTDERLLPHHDWIAWFNQQLEQLDEEEPQTAS